MARLEGFRARNFGPLRDVALGRPDDGRGGAAPLTPLTAVIGRNGSGKSALLDAFGFLADCIKVGVEDACDAGGRGGFSRLRSQGAEGPVGFQLRYRERGNARPLNYELEIDAAGSGRPRIVRERLRRGGGRGRPSPLLVLDDGEGRVWDGAAQGTDEGGAAPAGSGKGEPVALADRRRPGIAALGGLKRHPEIAGLRRFIKGWHLGSFAPDAARGMPLAGPRARLDPRGDNLANVVRFMEREHPGRFRKIEKAMAERIPGVDRIETEQTADGRMLLGFNDSGFQDPFYVREVSGGTLKMLALLLLLEGPAPPSLLCLRQPEDGLYHRLLEFLAGEFRRSAAGRRGGPQVFLTTHQPYLVDALDPEELWILEKGEDGFSTVRRASDNTLVVHLVAEELPLGGLWHSEYLESGSVHWTETV